MVECGQSLTSGEIMEHISHKVILNVGENLREDFNELTEKCLRWDVHL